MADEPQANTPAPEPIITTAPAVATPEPVPVSPLEWYSHIPQEYAKEKLWEPLKGKGMDAVLKGYAESQKKMGSAIFLPGDKDQPQDRAKKLEDIYGKLGRPKSATEYQVERPQMPDGMGWSDEHELGFKQTMHQLGLNNAQVQGIFNAYGSYINAIAPNQGKQVQEAETFLKDKWGSTYKQNRAMATRAVNTLVGDVLGNEDGQTFLKELEASGMANNPRLAMIFAKLGADMSERGLIHGEGDFTAESIQSELDKLEAKDSPFWNKRHPNHADFVKRRNDLLAQLDGPVLSR